MLPLNDSYFLLAPLWLLVRTWINFTEAYNFSLWTCVRNIRKRGVVKRRKTLTSILSPLWCEKLKVFRGTGIKAWKQRVLAQSTTFAGAEVSLLLHSWLLLVVFKEIGWNLRVTDRTSTRASAGLLVGGIKIGWLVGILAVTLFNLWSLLSLCFEQSGK